MLSLSSPSLSFNKTPRSNPPEGRRSPKININNELIRTGTNSIKVRYFDRINRIDRIKI
ncbi:hypothetical protein MNV_1030035 [Candidatus Methanoperedens nitroreducens]|uniref:Uncharacterized protein n=1 Tax=Candidatus Methanoperedens nitratireducens TaxID=1392998 RepID=A0A284VIB9_9EURY|nr:hypothetical protein MNV_1030035 [Candidatus Methanoperedens nitroreducens]